MRSKDTSIALLVSGIPARGGLERIVVRWVSSEDQRQQSANSPDDISVHIGPRLARYAHWHDLTISARRFGPIERLIIVDEPWVLQRMKDWERTHPRPTISHCRIQ